MKNLKRNQIIIFVVALMLVTAGYLSFTTNAGDEHTSVANSNVNKVSQIGAIGDAKLVSSNAIEQTNTVDGIVSDEALSTEETSNQNTNNISSESNKNINKENTDLSKTVETNSNKLDEYFSSSKLTRDTMYSQMIETYEKILENPNISADQKTISQTEIKNINDMKNKIMICENLIKTKGIENCVIFANGDSISVIVGTDNLEQDKIAQIQNIITREMQVDINNIHISNK